MAELLYTFMKGHYSTYTSKGYKLCAIQLTAQLQVDAEIQSDTKICQLLTFLNQILKLRVLWNFVLILLCA